MEAKTEVGRGRRHATIVVVLVVAVGAVQAVRGVGFALDDYISLGNAQFDGVWAAAGHDRGMQRPMDFVVFGLSFGVLGAHPLLHLAMLVALRAIAALLLLYLLRELVRPGIALLVTIIWILQPNHMSTELWSTASILDVALIGLLVGLVLAQRRPSTRRDLAIFVAMLLGALTYEAIVLIGIAALVVVPLLRGHSIDWRAVASGGAGLVLAGLWSLTHLEPSKHDAAKGFADLTPALSAHFGYGVAPPGIGSMVTLLVALVGVPLLAYAVVKGVVPREVGVLAAVGVAVIILGVLPYIRDNYEPQGGGDRANIVSSIGGAMVWAALLLGLWTVRRTLAVGVAVVLLALGLVRRWDVSGAWRDIFDDGRTVEAAVGAAHPDAGGNVVVSPPPPVCENIAVYLGSDMLTGLVRIAGGDGDLLGLRSDDPASAGVSDPTHIDLRTLALRCGAR